MVQAKTCGTDLWSVLLCNDRAHGLTKVIFAQVCQEFQKAIMNGVSSC